MNPVTIRVPATTANLGPGFDCFGCALKLYNTLAFEMLPTGLEITGCEEAYQNRENLAYVAYRAVMEKLGKPDFGVRIEIGGDIPVCRGLGSSAALLAAGAMAANCHMGEPLSREELLALTNAIEGHPDNLAPALFGGLTASMVAGGNPVRVSFPLDESWRFLVLIPEFTLSTRLARSVLPEQVNREDAIFNISRSAMVLKALETGNIELLKDALQDRLHQPYRKALIPDYTAIEALVAPLEAGMCLSGAGPTILCLTRSDAVEQTLRRELPGVATRSWQVLCLTPDREGARKI